VLRDLFPAIAGHEVTHRWGGPLGIPRDWFPTVAHDPATGLGSAGGYVGDGVASSNLAGRTLADLVRGEATDRTRLPWVNRRWEPEPLRWLGIHSMYRLFRVADEWEERRGLERTSLIARAAARITSLP